MKKIFRIIFYLTVFNLFIVACKNKNVTIQTATIKDSLLVNTKHLDHLYTPVHFLNGENAAGIYIYAEAPDYHLVGDSDEGFACVDDVARAALVYLRSKNFLTDTAAQNKTANLLRFILQMQSRNGYFYNFLFPDSSINTTGKTSVDTPNWWSWRALQTLTEATAIVKKTDEQLASRLDMAIAKLVKNIKSDLVNLPLSTKVVNGLTVPQWLPAGSATDQASILILGLINYCSQNEDAALKTYIRKLADGIILMQQGDSANLPFSAFMSWENVWHAYGSDQSFALLKAGRFLNDPAYIKKALEEVNNFYPWLLTSGMKSSFTVKKIGGKLVPVDEKEFAQIAYGIRPMIFAATEAFAITGDQKYADMAAQFGAWFFGKNNAGAVMYDKETGRCFDGIIAPGKLNKNAGAESTIEALLSLQLIEKYPVVLGALNKYKDTKK